METFLFGVFPYLAVVVTVAGAMQRFRTQRHTITAGSSQLLEGRLQYWGSVAWHHAILCVLLLHLAAIFLPGPVRSLLSAPGRLLAIEVTGFALGLTALWGLVVLTVRRVQLRAQTTWLDWLVLALLLVQVGTGVWIASSARWGLGWFTWVATPWLASLATLTPRVDLMVNLPWFFKVHALNAFVLLALVPYTRLAHAVVAPAGYLWRLPQLVVWLRPRNVTPGERP